MTEQEIIEKVQICFSNVDTDTDLSEIYQSDHPKGSIVRRLMNAYSLYKRNNELVKDFECSLRNYLLSFGTDIIIPGYLPETDNPFGLFSDHQSGRIFVNYNLPEYTNKEFVRTVFGMEEIKSFDKESFCPIHPFIYQLTNRRFAAFKSIEQQLAVMGALRVPEGYTALISMSTGGGKSLIAYSTAYQKTKGMTLIIVPTISLMLDQYRNARRIICPQNDSEIMYYHSGRDMNAITEAIKERKVRMLFISPETIIKNKNIYQCLMEANAEGYLNDLIIDEAHIIIEWGSSFRMDYQCLDAFRKELIRNNTSLRTFLLSATFSKQTTEDLKLFYSDNNRWIEIRLDALRKEPRFDVIKCRSYTEKHQRIKELVCKLPHPMIIYVNTPDDAEKLRNELIEYGFKNTRRFTGKTGSSERERIIKEWTDEQFDLMIATCAFGVGVDKKDVRTVLHTYVPSGPDQYYQECGRGGRDGLPCLSVMLYTEDDINSAKSLMQKVLTVEKLSGRWYSMINSSKANIRIGRVTLDTSVTPSYREKDTFYYEVKNADVNWNVNVILLLRRAGVISIDHVDFHEGKYIFTVSITDGETNGISNQSIMFNDGTALPLFTYVREEEFRRISRSISELTKMFKRTNKECWSSMFNEVYTLTDEYCAGCNYHNKPILGDKASFPLKKPIPFPVRHINERVSRMMNHMEEMLIINENEDRLLIRFLAASGVDMIVLPDDVMFDIDDIETDNTGMMMIGFHEFFELCRHDNRFFLSGSIAFFIGKNDQLAARLLRIKEGKQYSSIYIVSDNLYISGKNKNISELINGPCVRDYMITKEMG